MKIGLEFFLFLILIVWTLYIGIGFFRMIEKHKKLYDDNVEEDADKEDFYLEKF